MQKSYSALLAIVFLLFISMIACRNNSSQKENDKSNKIIEERARLDSLAQDLEKATKSIEEQAKELEKAMDTLNWLRRHLAVTENRCDPEFLVN